MKILLVKLSSLGDVVHTLPVVQDIRLALPHAQIDWVVEKALAPLLAPLQAPGAGLHRVIPCELRRWRQSPLSAVLRGQWNAFKAELRGVAYDAVIDLQGLSKSALVARLARLAPGGKRFALANRTDGSSYEAPTRWFADVAIRIEPRTHAVQRGRELAARALGYVPDDSPDFGFKQAATDWGKAQAAPETMADKPLLRQVALVHGTSRADKEWPTGHWIELGRRLNAAGFEVVLPHGSVTEYSTCHTIARALNWADDATPGAQVLPALELGALARRMAACSGAIGVDSGVSHMAVALGLPHVQLYNFDTTWRTGPPARSADQSPDQPQQFSVFDQPCPSVDLVWRAWLACGVEPAIVPEPGVRASMETEEEVESAAP